MKTFKVCHRSNTILQPGVIFDQSLALCDMPVLIYKFVFLNRLSLQIILKATDFIDKVIKLLNHNSIIALVSNRLGEVRDSICKSVPEFVVSNKKVHN